MNFKQDISYIAVSIIAALLIVSCGKKEEEVVRVSSVSVTPESVEITEGESAKLTAKISPAAAADRTVTWSSSDKTIATVDNSGNVKPSRPAPPPSPPLPKASPGNARSRSQP